jgi:hypothetical protein
MNALTTGRQHTLGDMEIMAKTLAGSGLFGAATPQQMFALMLIADADGAHPATVAREYDIIQGRPAIKAQAALARFQAAGGKLKYKVRTDSECTVHLYHPQGGEVTVTWDMAKAKREGLDGKDNYRKRPGVMFQWRAVAEGIRAILPGCLSGVYMAEEVQDFDPPKRLSGAEVPQADAVPLVTIQEKPKAKVASRAKATELIERARAIGFTDEAIAAAIGADLDGVTIPAAKAFFTIVEAEELAYSEKMQEITSHDQDAKGAPEQA